MSRSSTRAGRRSGCARSPAPTCWSRRASTTPNSRRPARCGGSTARRLASARLMRPALVASEIVVTNARGAHSEAIAEHAIALLLALRRRLHVAAAGQAARILAAGGDRGRADRAAVGHATSSSIGLGIDRRAHRRDGGRSRHAGHRCPPPARPAGAARRFCRGRARSPARVLPTPTGSCSRCRGRRRRGR